MLRLTDHWDQIWIIETKTANVLDSITRPKPRLKRSESQWWDRDWKCLSLNNETKTETEMSKSQWRDRDWKDVSLNDETETAIVWVSITRPRLKNLSLNDETKTEKIWVSETRLVKICRYRDSIETLADIWLPISGEGTDLCTLKWILFDTGLLVGWSGFFLFNAVKCNKWIDFDWIYLVWLDSLCLAFLCRMNQRDFDILRMSRPRLIKTGKFLGCRDRDLSRLRNFLDVKTETHRDWKISWMSRLRNFLGVETETSRDWAKGVDTETPSRLLLISVK